MPSITHSEEKNLIAACSEGDPESWSAFVSRYDRTIRITAATVRQRRHVHPFDLDDLTAYVYERLLDDRCRRLRRWEGRSIFTTYLVKVVKNLCTDFIDRHCKGLKVNSHDDELDRLNGHADPTQEILDRAQIEILAREISKLSPKQSMIMRLRMQGRSLREIAELLSLPQGTVFGENARALERLRAALSSSFDSSPDAAHDESSSV